MSSLYVYDAINIFKYSPTGQGTRRVGGDAAYQQRYARLIQLAVDKMWLLWRQDEIGAEILERNLMGDAASQGRPRYKNQSGVSAGQRAPCLLEYSKSVKAGRIFSDIGSRGNSPRPQPQPRGGGSNLPDRPTTLFSGFDSGPELCFASNWGRMQCKVERQHRRRRDADAQLRQYATLA